MAIGVGDESKFDCINLHVKILCSVGNTLFWTLHYLFVCFFCPDFSQGFKCACQTIDHCEEDCSKENPGQYKKKKTYTLYVHIRNDFLAPVNI